MGQGPNRAIAEPVVELRVQVLLDPAQGAAVRDDGDALAGVALGDPANRAEDSFSMRFVRLAVPRAVADLIAGQPLARSDVDLTQVGIEAVSRARLRSLA